MKIREEKMKEMRRNKGAGRERVKTEKSRERFVAAMRCEASGVGQRETERGRERQTDRQTERRRDTERENVSLRDSKRRAAPKMSSRQYFNFLMKKLKRDSNNLINRSLKLSGKRTSLHFKIFEDKTQRTNYHR